MGARGANIQKVCSDFNVQIKIPDRKSNKAQQNGTTNENNEDTNGQENPPNFIFKIPCYSYKVFFTIINDLFRIYLFCGDKPISDM